MGFVGRITAGVAVKSSQVVGLRDRVANIRALLHAIPRGLRLYGDLSGVGRIVGGPQR